MFRRLAHTLPPDPSFPVDLEKLGFFVTTEDKIRQIQNPSHKFQYRINTNERVNQAYKLANNLAVRNIILERLEELGVETVRLPLGAKEGEKHVPILVSKDIKSKKRVILFLGERQMEPGVLSWRAIGEQGIKHGSLVDLVDALKNGSSSTDESSGPGIIVANPCQLLWYRGGRRAVSRNEWMDLPRETGVSEAMRIDEVKNYIDHNRDYTEHINYVFDQVLPELVRKDAKVDIIGLEYSVTAAFEYLAKHWNTWSQRITGICIAGAQYKMADLVANGAPPEFVDFISKRCRFYAPSSSPLETPVTGRQRFGCNCYASGEDEYHENVVVKAWRSMLGWFDFLYTHPAYEEIELVVDEVASEEVNLGWSGEQNQ
ncbi:hypothetical protein LTR84_007194 [Exophiala bonariae]|uniref:Arb2 domain-containing protein n=1 Tax=Exophiala bonariae TaxID=1690606 RepID=A0AAV9MYZ0_9EURO|nr:hypothetical protein LTR84_007194 [Exophiala bonariae]